MRSTQTTLGFAAAYAALGYWFVYHITADPTPALVGAVSTGCLSLLADALRKAPHRTNSTDTDQHKTHP